MANVYQIDWEADALAKKIEEESTFKFDDSFWEKFADTTRHIVFGPEFLNHIASKLNVQSMRNTFKLKSNGTQNTHYSLQDCNGKKYIMRFGGGGLSVEKEARGDRIVEEYQKLKLLEDLCPEAFRVYFLDDSKKFVSLKYFVGDFIEGKCLGIDVTDYTNQMIVDTARVAKRIHSVGREVLEQKKFPSNSFLYDPIDSIFPEFGENDGTLPRNLYYEVQEATKDVVPLVIKSPMGLTHGDFHYANMIQTEAGIRPVDWEFCHIGCQIADIATFVGASGLGPSEEQSSLFLKEYGYGKTLEERLVLWYFRLKRAVLMIFIWPVMPCDDASTVNHLHGLSVGMVTHLLANKPK